jgi:4-oxalocrotonate tautomerase
MEPVSTRRVIESRPVLLLHRSSSALAKRRKKMPYITVESGNLSDAQKEELIKRLTEVSSEIMNVPQEFFVTTIKEVSDKNFGIGGKTIDIIKAEYMRPHTLS